MYALHTWRAVGQTTLCRVILWRKHRSRTMTTYFVWQPPDCRGLPHHILAQLSTLPRQRLTVVDDCDRPRARDQPQTLVLPDGRTLAVEPLSSLRVASRCHSSRPCDFWHSQNSPQHLPSSLARSTLWKPQLHKRSTPRSSVFIRYVWPQSAQAPTLSLKAVSLKASA